MGDKSKLNASCHNFLYEKTRIPVENPRLSPELFSHQYLWFKVLSSWRDEMCIRQDSIDVLLNFLECQKDYDIRVVE